MLKPSLLVLALLASTGVQAQCPPADWDAPRLLALKTAKFVVDDAAVRNTLALALLDCLGDADPALRDGVAFEGLSSWLRTDALAAETRLALYERLVPQLGTAGVDAGGFRQPFAALVLSEVARTDRIKAWMTPAQRGALVEAAAVYLEGIRDYRGFDAAQGWRHGVAHGSDLALQLVLNPALDKPQIDRLLAAVAHQVAPATHAYTDGESERLARPVLYAATRRLHDEAHWKAWFAALVPPAPAGGWGEAFRSREGLNRLHNLKAFLAVVYLNSRDSESPALAELAVPVLAASQQLP